MVPGNVARGQDDAQHSLRRCRRGQVPARAQRLRAQRGDAAAHEQGLSEVLNCLGLRSCLQLYQVPSVSVDGQLSESETFKGHCGGSQACQCHCQVERDKGKGQD